MVISASTGAPRIRARHQCEGAHWKVQKWVGVLWLGQLVEEDYRAQEHCRLDPVAEDYAQAMQPLPW